MGIVAREVEAMQMTQLTGMIPEQFGAVSLALAQGVIEHTSIPNKANITKLVNEALAPPDEETQAKQKALTDLQYEAAKAEAQGALLQNQKTIAEIRKLLAEANKYSHQAGVEDDKVMIEAGKLQLMEQELEHFAEQNRIASQRLDLQQQQLDLKKREIKNKPAK